jgi:prolyl-tRNA synthetase
MSKLVGNRLKEIPRDAQTASHIFLIRGGYVRPVSAGIYTLLSPAKRITAKIEAILREEMNRVDGQEITMPVVLSGDLWQESGRYEGVGDELLRFQDRNGKNMVLAMTHEEAACHIARTELTSYKQLPVMFYQIQTKYRDEARPRAGLIRVREFTMKDGYSFHETQECLDQYYRKVLGAYERFFKRVGLPYVISIEADSGMMGGAVSHEFMALADCGEDTLFLSPDGSYRANREIAVSRPVYKREDLRALEKVLTPDCKTIGDLARFLNIKAEDTGKAVFYEDDQGKLVLAVIRGDRDINETKLKNLLKIKSLTFAGDEIIRTAGCVPGYASPYNMDPTAARVVLDFSASESTNLAVGANEEGYHLINFNPERDCSHYFGDFIIADIALAAEGDPCPVTGEPLEMKRGIEVGNIFQLGTKYSEPMGSSFLDSNGKKRSHIMGCYGIGIGRTMAAVIEQCHDSYGPIWPLPIAPWQIHLCALDPKKEGVRKAADKLYDDLIIRGIEVLYDDRGEKAGSMFNDADLLGIPFRVILSTKTIERDCFEFRRRDCRDTRDISLVQGSTILADLIKSELEKYISFTEPS